MIQTKILTVPFRAMLDEGIYLDSEAVNGWVPVGAPYYERDQYGDEHWHLNLKRVVVEI
jgi:hypothetical protein